MIKPLEATYDNANSVQRVIFEHYSRINGLTEETVRQFVADPGNESMAKKQLQMLEQPTCSRFKGGNKTPVYGGSFNKQGELVGVIKASVYKPRAFRDPYLNIHELVVSDPNDYVPFIFDSLRFATEYMKLPANRKASVETFDIKSETESYISVGFRRLDVKNLEPYKIGSKTLQICRMVKPNLA